MYLILKFTLSAAIIVAVSEIARLSPRLGGLFASLPLVSMLRQFGASAGGAP